MSQSSGETPQSRVGGIELSESDRHRLLASERRRVVLDVLANRSPPVDLEDLAGAVAAREADEGRDGSDAGRVAIMLHHRHLPILTEIGVLEYEPSSRRIETVHATIGRP